MFIAIYSNHRRCAATAVLAGKPQGAEIFPHEKSTLGGTIALALSEARREDRRRRIVAAAQSLLRDRYDASFSMAELARRAGVSPATPYNLVGSKAGVLQLVVEEEYRGFIAKLPPGQPKGALQALLAATALVVTHYVSDRKFYRTLYYVIYGSHLPIVTENMVSLGRNLWRGLVRGAVEAGELCDTVAVEPFADNLLRAISSVTLNWLAENWSHARFEREMSLSIRLLVASVARQDLQPSLRAEIAACHAALERGL
jgi:AcrR family transcriptional regulator